MTWDDKARARVIDLNLDHLSPGTQMPMRQGLWTKDLRLRAEAEVPLGYFYPTAAVFPSGPYILGREIKQILPSPIDCHGELPVRAESQFALLRTQRSRY